MTTPAPDLAKRAMDAAAWGLLALPLAVPGLMALIALAGCWIHPARCGFGKSAGRAGRLFRIHKFRTMRVTMVRGRWSRRRMTHASGVGRWLGHLCSTSCRS